MKKGILVNLLFFTPKSPTGVFVYADALLRELIQRDEEHTYWIAVRPDMYEYLRNAIPEKSHVHFLRIGNYSFLLSKLAAYIFRRKDILEGAVRECFQQIIDRRSVRIVFFPSGSIYPSGLRNVITVVTLYDLQHEYFPEHFNEAHYSARRRGNYIAAHAADHILAISKFTKRTLIEKYQIPANKITVTYLAPQRFGAPASIQLSNQYLLYPAALWPHKNHAVLVEAMNHIKDVFPQLQVILTGTEKKKGMARNILERAAQRGLGDRVHYLGHVSPGIMSTIYDHATALVFPSSFEGFGMPLVEAFIKGVPVIAADNTSIREIVGDAGILVPTGDAVGLAEAIKNVIDDENLCADLVKKGHARAALFSWEKTAEATLGVFNRLS